MTFLTLRIKALAFLGNSPREIEKKLGFTPYTIHKCYHKELQEGYAKREGRGRQNFSTEETRKILLGLYRSGQAEQTIKGATA